jgi:hypothetical protein
VAYTSTKRGSFCSEAFCLAATISSREATSINSTWAERVPEKTSSEKRMDKKCVDFI